MEEVGCCLGGKEVSWKIDLRGFCVMCIPYGERVMCTWWLSSWIWAPRLWISPLRWMAFQARIEVKAIETRRVVRIVTRKALRRQNRVGGGE